MDTEKRLKMLESKSEYIIREANFKFKRLGLLWSGGKDSTLMLALARQSLPEEQFKKMPVVFLNTGYQFKETYAFIYSLSKHWGFHYYNWKVTSEAYPRNDRFKCCTERKTESLRKAIKMIDMDAIMVGIRRDEQEIRNKERFYSPRSTEGRWDYWHQPIEMQGWDLYVEEVKEGEHMRVHPILEWNEIDVWEYTKLRNIPVNPIYFSEDGTGRFRSVGCEPCTLPMTSDASTIDEIIEELERIGGNEREGRQQDKEAGMQRLRELGYL